MAFMEQVPVADRVRYLVEYRFAPQLAACDAAEREARQGNIELLMETV